MVFFAGIGASAGGLAAFEAFFTALPADDTGTAFILVQHLSPDHESILAELVQRYARMPVHEAADGMEIRADRVYVIPPNCDMALVGGKLSLLAPAEPRGHRLPIDFFFRSLAEDQHERAIGIVLSGTGSDGTFGVRAIKGEGGLVMVQQPETAEFDGMPRSAIATGVADYVLPPGEMPARLLAYTRHAAERGPHVESAASDEAAALQDLCVLLREHTGHDFSLYKETTVVRRVRRRMAIHAIERSEDYVEYARRNPEELDALFRDLLIGVTRFFRDPEALGALATQVLPGILASKAPHEPIRVWVCGCSTGEEAYSIAILFAEALEAQKLSRKVQIFATDMDPRAIAQARLGLFPASIAADVSPERLARFFTADPGGATYRIQKRIRDLVIFSEQDVVADPPFSRLDLVSCRNVLIYMSPELQKKIMPLFRYALLPGGCLFLGMSETPGDLAALFEVVDRKAKIYRRKPGGSVLENLPGERRGPTFAGPRFRAAELADAGPPKLDLRGITERCLLGYLGAAGVLVDARGEILHIYGRTGKYLEPASGDVGTNVLPMAREGLRQELGIALHRAVGRQEVVRSERVRVQSNGDVTIADLTVLPLAGRDAAAPGGLYVVVLEEAATESPAVGAGHAESGPVPDASRIATLEQELRSKDEYLQTVLEEMETSHEELTATNEELQSLNEELQSTNEELQTSKEELQSINEELATVNGELQAKLAALARVNNDMNNLLAGTGVGTLFVDHQLRITRFTPTITQVINLIEADVGRPVRHIASNLVGYDRLVEDVQAVLDTLVPYEAEVQTRAGEWLLMRIRPYRTLENVIEGAVLTFVDVTDRKKAEEAFRRLSEITKYYDAIPVGLAVLDIELHYLRINAAFAAIHGRSIDAHIGHTVAEIATDRAERVRTLTRRILATGLPETGVAMTRDGRTWFESWYPIRGDGGQIVGFSVLVQPET